MDVERTMSFILEQQTHAAAIQARHHAEIARIDSRLRRAIRSAVLEAREERKRRCELEERFELRMDRLAGAFVE